MPVKSGQWQIVSEQDYAEWDAWIDTRPWYISEWELPIVPAEHWLWDVAPVNEADLQPIPIRVRVDMHGEPWYIVGDHGEEFDDKDAAWSLARTLARLKYGSAMRKYKGARAAADQREKYEQRRLDDATASAAKVLMEIITQHPDILDSYRASAA